ncbi:hypothetical protein CKA32_000098 [Geitlerinema sp. FC II]|nr:hypothetical protein CKA32_000098 [Geitlerinema sp. FC II]
MARNLGTARERSSLRAFGVGSVEMCERTPFRVAIAKRFLSGYGNYSENYQNWVIGYRPAIEGG